MVSGRKDVNKTRSRETHHSSKHQLLVFLLQKHEHVREQQGVDVCKETQEPHSGWAHSDTGRACKPPYGGPGPRTKLIVVNKNKVTKTGIEKLFLKLKFKNYN